MSTSQYVLSIKDKRRNLKFPKRSSDLAEFIGIITGDGYANYYPSQEKYLIEIAGHSELDSRYLKGYVQDLVVKLFNIQPTVYTRNDQKCMYLRIIKIRRKCQKRLTTFLIIKHKKDGDGTTGI
ncbi:MAG: hypothetical protein ABH879_02620 [archaeon]